MVRAFVRAMLTAWHLDSLTEDAELIASELASNAVAASTDSDGQPAYISGHMPVVQVCLLTDGVRTLLEVWDQAPGIPLIRDATGCEESGRGLVLIDAIADRWGWSPATGRPGKIVWAEMSLSLCAPSRASAPTSPDRPTCAVGLMKCLPRRKTVRGSPVPEPSRGHDVSGLTAAELERARRDLQASLALARPGSATYVPILAHLSAINAELAGRSAGCAASGKPSSLDARTPGDAGPATGEL